MPKSTHFYQTRDAQVTDKKFRPEDERIYQEEKQELRTSDEQKKAEPITEDEFMTEQDRKIEDELITRQDRKPE